MQDNIYEQYSEAFRKSGQRQVEIVYDVDDILWELLRRVTSRLGIDYVKSSAIFKIFENPELTQNEKEAIFAAFGNAEMFEEIEFLPGAEEILRPKELGARVKIKSNSFNQQIADLKYEQLLRHIPGLTPGDIVMRVIDSSATYQKKFDDTMTILVDDSPCNVALSNAVVNVMPSSISWSTGPEAAEIMKGKPVVWRPDLIEMNQFIYEATEAMMEA